MWLATSIAVSYFFRSEHAVSSLLNSIQVRSFPRIFVPRELPGLCLEHSCRPLSTLKLRQRHWPT